MPQSIPPGLKQEPVLHFLGYELVHEGKRYPPRAFGPAFRHHTGRVLLPEEGSGGGSPGQANGMRRNWGSP
jgi:hypothetical protein